MPPPSRACAGTRGRQHRRARVHERGAHSGLLRTPTSFQSSINGPLYLNQFNYGTSEHFLQLLSDYIVHSGVMKEALCSQGIGSTVYLYSFDYLSAQAPWRKYFDGNFESNLPSDDHPFQDNNRSFLNFPLGAHVCLTGFR